jgi:hypothetical protein
MVASKSHYFNWSSERGINKTEKDGNTGVSGGDPRCINSEAKDWEKTSMVYHMDTLLVRTANF